MSSSTSSSYDRIPYEGFALFQTHPDHLAALAALFGVSTPDVETSRVLELGCARGENLIPMAVSLPRARLLGIDVSRRQIEEGRNTLTALGLTNIELREIGIMDVDVEFGQFDFIVAHGVYSWIDKQVQEALLQLCADRLTPNGLAYVSYNTYPGWHMGTMVRDMMLYHTRNVTNENERVRSSRKLLARLAGLFAKYENSYARCLREEAEGIEPRPDFYIFHEYLAETNQPLYFHQFLTRAAAHGLQYLGEAQFRNMAVAQSTELFEGPEVSGFDWVAREQYHDFLKGQSFRQSVLCHDNRPCSRTPSPSALKTLRITGNVRPGAASKEFGSKNGSTETFQSLAGETVFATSDPLVKILLRVLWEAWPTSVPFATLLERSQSRSTLLGALADDLPRVTSNELANSLISCLAKGLIDLHVLAPAFTTEINSLPRASPSARRQALTGPRVANLRHQVVTLLEFDRLVLAYLDGRHDRRGLVAELKTAVNNGVLTMHVQGCPVTDLQEAEHLLATALEESLTRLAAGALLF